LCGVRQKGADAPTPLLRCASKNSAPTPVPQSNLASASLIVCR
jgi:hypothetical protein